MITPIKLLNSWLLEEKSAGAPNAQQAVLSTCKKNEAIPHARVVAIREITEDGFLFFTQRNTKKVHELLDNPLATIVFWFELFQREVIVEGAIEPLSETENLKYWQNYPRENQIRFTSYAATSSQPIANKELLENKKRQLEEKFSKDILPMSPFYCGFRLKPERMIFYAFRLDELSDVFEYCLQINDWKMQRLSP